MDMIMAYKYGLILVGCAYADICSPPEQSEQDLVAMHGDTPDKKSPRFQAMR